MSSINVQHHLFLKVRLLFVATMGIQAFYLYPQGPWLRGYLPLSTYLPSLGLWLQFAFTSPSRLFLTFTQVPRLRGYLPLSTYLLSLGLQLQVTFISRSLPFPAFTSGDYFSRINLFMIYS